MNFEKQIKGKPLAPPPVSDSENSFEILRVWSEKDGPQQLTLLPTWNDPGAWGLVLVDIARHAAKAYAHEGHDELQALNRIKELFDSEWLEPTDEPEDITPTS